MSIKKRGNIWWYRFMWNGKLLRGSTRQGNFKVARQIEAAIRTRLAKGEVGIRDKKVIPTLSEFIANRITPWGSVQTSWQWYRSGIRPLLGWNDIANTPIDAITSETVSGFAAHRQSDGLAVGTVNRELRVLRRVLRLAVEWGVTERAPKVTMLKGERHRERVVGDQEFEQYLVSASPLLAEVATVLHDTGLRPEEAHRLRWDDIDLVNGRNGRLHVRRGKTKAARRELPLTPRARAVFESRWQQSGQEGWVWPALTKTGHINHSTLKKQHKKALRMSGVRDFLLYSLRHSFATAIAPRVDAWTLCKIMGWSSLSVAMTYVHPQEERVLEAFPSDNGHNFEPSLHGHMRLGCGDGTEQHGESET